MAGMLPGVESARRRRCRGTTTGSPDLCSSSSFPGTSNSSRRSTLCLYTSNHISLLSSNSGLLQQRSMVNSYQQQQEDEKLGGVAREAKERLDERLRAQYRKSEPNRRNSTGSVRINVLGGGRTSRDEDRNQGATGLELRRSSSSAKKLIAKLKNWKSTEQEECAVCLEQFKSTEDLSHLPCAHRFHSKCLLPWLQNNAHCPCCRTPI